MTTMAIYRVMVYRNGENTGACQGAWLNKVVAERNAERYARNVATTHPRLSYVVTKDTTTPEAWAEAKAIAARYK